MKSIQTLLLLFLGFVSYGQNLNPYTASQRLQDAVNDSPEDYHKVLFLFADRVDALAMNENFYARNLTLSQRNVELFSALQTKANSVQAPYLEILQASSQVKNVRSFWISNIIYAEVQGDFLAELSQDRAIDFMDLSVPLLLDKYSSAPTPLPPTPNGAEPGLKTINADAMWAMGYTGYGRTALVSDSGVDVKHPALSGKFRGNYIALEQAAYNHLGFTDFLTFFGTHGTHVTGTIMGLDRATNDTIGVAFNAQWMPSMTTVFNGLGSVDNIATFQWALNPDGDPATTDDMPDVINNSWQDSSVEEDCNNVYLGILNTLEATKIAIVFSAGNNGPDAATMTNPKNINTSLVNTFTVGALSDSVTIAEFSSRGPSTCPSEGSLAIKPEVSAPGLNIRSCASGNNYQLMDGTSMAAPHVSGAILLLREAFPNTTGTEVKMALYMSATDIGEIGEDNTFGMGLINIAAAYDYLIAQGHTPVPPVSKERDIIATNLEFSRNTCPEYFEFTLSFANNGVENLTDLTIDYTAVGLSKNYQWSGDLLPGETTSIIFEEPDITEGTHDLQVILSAPNSLIDDRPLNNRITRRILVDESTPIAVYAEGGLDDYCDASEVHLRADYQGPGEVEVEWFEQIHGGNSIGSGAILNVGIVEEPQIFFAECNFRYYSGKTSLGATSGFVEASNPGLQFDALKDFTLKSILIYYETPGGRLLQLENESGQAIETKVVNAIGVGQSRVTLGFDIPQGNNYKLIQKLGEPLLSNTEGAQFPYVTDGVIRFDKSLSDNPEQSLSKYHCFYSWEIERSSNCGRLPVMVNVVSGENIPTADFTSSQTEVVLVDGEASVDFVNISDGATSFLWNFGDGTTDNTNDSPMHTFTELGTYFVSLTAFNADGCSDTQTIEITVADNVMSRNSNVSTPLWDIVLFPNPTQNEITIDFALKQAQNLSYRVVDLYGRTVIATSSQHIETAQISLDMSGIASGVYYIIFENKQQQRMVRRVVKM